MQNTTDDDKHKEPEEWSKARVLKNLAALSGGIFLYLSAGIPSRELQSSLNFKGGLGTNSLAIGGAINFLPSIMLTPYFLRKFGLKPCIVTAMMIGSTSHFANFYSRWYTLIPMAILDQIGTAPMWAAKGTYISYMADTYSRLTGIGAESVTSFFFGVFYSSLYAGYILGNLLPYFVLIRDHETVSEGVCGYNFCDGPRNYNNTNFHRPPNYQVYILFGTFAGVAFMGALVVLFCLDNLHISFSKKDSWSRLFDSIRLFKRWEQICLFFICAFRGLNKALLVADFSKAYITCTWGMRNIGSVMISFGLTCGILSSAFGYLTHVLGRPFLFAFSVSCNLAIMLTMIFWEPSPKQPYVFFILVCLWGASYASWESQIAALTPTLFPNDRDAAFTNYSNTENIGWMVGQGISAPVCMKYKIFGNLAVLCAAAVSFTSLEIGPLRKAKLGSQKLRADISVSYEMSMPLLPMDSSKENE